MSALFHRVLISLTALIFGKGGGGGLGQRLEAEQILSAASKFA